MKETSSELEHLNSLIVVSRRLIFWRSWVMAKAAHYKRREALRSLVIGVSSMLICMYYA